MARQQDDEIGLSDLITDDADYLPSFISNGSPQDDGLFISLVDSIMNQPINLSTPPKRRRGRPKKSSTNASQRDLFTGGACDPSTSRLHMQKQADHQTEGKDQQPGYTIIEQNVRAGTTVSSDKASSSKSNMNQPIPTRKRRRRTKVVNALIDDLPADINMNFSKWFYGDLSQFRPKSKQKPDDFKPIVDRFIEKQINFTFEPDRHKYLTENLSPVETQPFGIIKDYRMTLEDQTRPDQDEIEPSSNSEVTSPNKSPGKSKKNKISFMLCPKNIVVDRRPMLNRCLRDTANKPSGSLIEPDEDCDYDYVEIPEIDCDKESREVEMEEEEVIVQ